VTGVTFVTSIVDVVGKPRKLLAGRRRGDGSGVVSVISLKHAGCGSVGMVGSIRILLLKTLLLYSNKLLCIYKFASTWRG
jgi:hypothetical protein